VKEIKAFVRPNMLDAVLRAMHEHPDLPGVTVSDVRGFGRVAGRKDSGSTAYGTIKMAKIECIVSDDRTSMVMDLIREHASTGRPGDGKIAIHAIESLVRIRTGEPVPSAE
jgi:nitrogen regulatory protein P-II 1